MSLFKEKRHCLKRFTDGCKLEPIRLKNVESGMFVSEGINEPMFSVERIESNEVRFTNAHRVFTKGLSIKTNDNIVYKSISSLVYCVVCKVLVNDECSHCPYCSWRF